MPKKKAPPYLLVFQSPRGTELASIAIHRRPPYSEEDIERLGEMAAELVEEGIVAYEHWHLKARKKCRCYARDRPPGHPAQFTHSSSCPVLGMPGGPESGL